MTFQSPGQREPRWRHRFHAWWRLSGHEFNHGLWVRSDHFGSTSDRQRGIIGSQPNPTTRITVGSTRCRPVLRTCHVISHQSVPINATGYREGNNLGREFRFPIDRAKDVAMVMKGSMDDSSHATSGLIMSVAPPPARQPSIIAARYIGDSASAAKAYKPLYNINPTVANGSQVPLQNISDAREAIGAKGDLKHFGIVGVHRFDIDLFLKTVEIWKELIAECPDAINTAFNFQWDSRPVKSPPFESAMCLHDIRFDQ